MSRKCEELIINVPRFVSLYSNRDDKALLRLKNRIRESSSLIETKQFCTSPFSTAYYILRTSGQGKQVVQRYCSVSLIRITAPQRMYRDVSHLCRNYLLLSTYCLSYVCYKCYSTAEFSYILCISFKCTYFFYCNFDFEHFISSVAFRSILFTNHCKYIHENRLSLNLLWVNNATTAIYHCIQLAVVDCKIR